MDRPPRIGINGFGRIGRLVARALVEMDPKVDIVAINDVSSPETLAHLFAYDSVHGHYPGPVEVDGDHLTFNGDRFLVTKEPDPAKLPWRELEADIVIDCTGRFRKRGELQAHLDAGAGRVILSAPGDGMDATFVRGVNSHTYDPARHRIVSNASCTTNCLATTLKVLHGAFGVQHASMTTVHAYTNDQRLLDSQHRDLRLARAAGLSMLPSTTGASKAISEVLPELTGKVDGMSIRVPLPNVSIVDLTARLDRKVSVAELHQAYEEAAKGPLRGILRCESRPLVSVDFNHDPHSSIVDVPTLMSIDGAMAKVLAWYDNEWGYSNRTAELVHEMWAREPGA